jgi:hypothetical protein
MKSPAKLNDTQLMMLSAASQREDRCVIAPAALKGGAVQKLAAKLLSAGLVREIKTKAGMEQWRRDDETGQEFSLKLTAAGLRAIAIDEGESQVAANADAPTTVTDGDLNPEIVVNGSQVPTAPIAPAPMSFRQGTKIARVIELLQREEGASLDELIAATGWLPHTARAALTGLRHRGFDVRLERGANGNASVYRAITTLAIAS